MTKIRGSINPLPCGKISRNISSKYNEFMVITGSGADLRGGSWVSILSGDVHVTALGVLRNTRIEDGYGESSINQLTSSAIVHPGPPPILMYMYDLTSRNPTVVDTGITAELVKLPAANHRFVPSRNWLALEIEANSKRRLWANWHVENDEIPYTKAVHCITQ